MVTAGLAASFRQPKDLVHAALSSRGWDIVSKKHGERLFRGVPKKWTPYTDQHTGANINQGLKFG